MTRPISRRGFLAAAGGVAAAAGLAACGSSAGGGTTSGKGFSMWNAFQDPRQETFFKEQYLNPWNTSHASLPLSMTVKPVATMLQLQQTALGAGDGPDILAASGSSGVIPMAQAKQIVPLDSYSQKYGWDKLLLPWAFGASSWEGKLWSVPTVYETMVMYYNPAVFAQHGWTPPTNLAETEALFAEAQGRGLQPITAGNADWRGANEWWVTMFWNHYAGPDALYQALTGQIKWSDPVFVEPLQILQQWFAKGWVGKSSQDYFTTHFPTCYTNLVNGKALTYWSGTWEFANMPLYFGPAGHNSQTWSWANLPQLRPEIPAVLNELSIGGTYSINATAKNPDSVAQFLSWFLNNKTAAVTGLKLFGNEPPPIPLTASDWVAGTNPNFSRAYDQLAVTSKAGNIGYTTWTFWPPKSDTYIIDSMDGVITGSTKPQDYCAGLDAVFQTELAQKRVPPLFKPNAYAAT